MDPWVVAADEKLKHEEQFRNLRPLNGMLTGAQAKSFFLQSGLAPMVLAKIWGLADVTGDGQMDINEFLVACKLITNKLKGMDIPAALPAALSYLITKPLTTLPLSTSQPVMSAPLMQQNQAAFPLMSQAPLPIRGVSPIPLAPMATTPGFPAPFRPPSAPIPSSDDWCIPSHIRIKYTQQFASTDRARNGYLIGVQARNVLLQSGLPQPVLAQIWSLSDIDNDGRLTMDEFILAGYLCEIALKGETLPRVLPANMVPPSMRKTPSNQAMPAAVAKVVEESISPTFEDKRRENFNKGQAELERRRQSLLEQQRKEEEERRRKEKKEQEERERQRLEMERQRMAEWEKYKKAEMTMCRDRERETLQTIKLRHGNVAKDMEQLGGKVTSLTVRISSLRDGVAETKNEIDGMRIIRDQKVQEMNQVKQRLEQQNQRFLDVTQEKARLQAANMLNLSKMPSNNDLSEFKTRQQEQQKRVQDLRDRLDKLRSQESLNSTLWENEKEQLNQHRDNLRKIIESCKQLFSQFEERRLHYKNEKSNRLWQLTTQDTSSAWESDFGVDTVQQLSSFPMNQSNASFTSNGHAVLYRALFDFDATNSDELPFKTGDLITVYPGQPHEPGWLGGELHGKVGWFPESYVELVSEPSQHQPAALEPIVEESATPLTTPTTDAAIPLRARALHQWTAQEPDNDISFQRGDILIVLSTMDPNWWFGHKEFDQHKGYFPANHVTVDHIEVRGTTPASGPEVVGSSPEQQPTSAHVKCISLYSYSSNEAGDLCFDADVEILVLKKDGDWWTGQIGDSVGVFPYNYVQVLGSEEYEEKKQAELPVEAPAAPPGIDDDDVRSGASPANDSETKQAASVLNGNMYNSKKSDPFKEASDTSKEAMMKPEAAVALANYSASGKEQLSLTKGQEVLVRKKTDTGWWQGEIPAGPGKKRQVGWFPASYVQLKAASESGSADAPPPAISSPSPSAMQSHPTKVPAQLNVDGKTFRALFAYVGRHEDELSFEADDVITLISKEEDAWWKGRLEGQGRVGVFPSNYVTPLEPSVHVEAGLTQRGHVIQELFTTELAFLEALHLVRDFFVIPLIQAGHLDQQELDVIFINWNELMTSSNRLCKSLKIRKKMSSAHDFNVGDILCENILQMSGFIRFCATQLNSAALLQKLVEIKPGFDDFLRQCQSHPKIQGMPLSYYLLKPVKRVTDYPVLVGKLLKHTPHAHPDHAQLAEALALARNLCDQVNEGMRHKENSERLEWLQLHVDCRSAEMTWDEKLNFNSETNFMGPRKFLHHGLLTKNKSGKEIVAFLLNDFLLLTLPNRSIGPSQFSFDKHHQVKLKFYKEPLFLGDISLATSNDTGSSSWQSGTDQGLSIQLDLKNHGSLVLDALSIHDRTLWCQKLTQAIDDFKKMQKLNAANKSVEEQGSRTGRVLVVLEEASLLSSAIKTPSAWASHARGELHLVLIGACNLKRPQGKGKIDPYCEVSMGSQEHKTCVVRGTCNPKWNASMQFWIKDVHQDVLCVTVFDKDYFSPNEFLGRTEIRLWEVLQEKSQQPGGPLHKKLPLLETDSGTVSVRIDLQMFPE